MNFKLREKCPCSELFWSSFSRIRTEYGETPVQIHKTADQNNSEYGQFLRQARLIEDLFADRYDFILTAPFQSDPLEKCFGKYRQMSRGCFLVGLKNVICSEKVLKIQRLLKEDTDIDVEIKISCPKEMRIMKLKTDVDSLEISLDTPMLSPNSREFVAHIAGYTAKKYLKKIKSSSCYKMDITGSIDMENLDQEYLIILNRRGLAIPSPNLVNYVCDKFTVLKQQKISAAEEWF